MRNVQGQARGRWLDGRLNVTSTEVLEPQVELSCTCRDGAHGRLGSALVTAVRAAFDVDQRSICRSSQSDGGTEAFHLDRRF